MMIKTLHLIGSKTLGGAEKWFFKCTKVLREYGIHVYTGIRAGSELEDLAKENQFNFCLPFYTVWDPISRFSISKLVKRLRPEIVQTYMSRATRLTRVSPKKAVHVARLGGYYGLKAFKHAHAWIGNTKGICDYLIQNGFPKEKVFYITNFVDLPKLAPREKLRKLKDKMGILDEDFIMVHPARFVPVKGHETLFKAVHLLANDRELKRRFKVILLGDGPLKSHLLQQANKLNIDKYLIWAGWQNNVSMYYQLSNLVVFPSMEQETLGNVILEAWAHRKPVICTRFRGAMEITKDLEDVLQADCLDSKALYFAIKRAIMEKDLRDYIAKNGYKKVIKHFTKEIIVNQYIEVYKYLLRKT